MDISRGIGSLKITQDDVVSSATDFFKKPSYEISVTDGKKVSFTAENLDSSGPYRITLTGNGEQFIDTNDAYLYLVASCTKADGTAIGADENCAFVNNIGASLFDSVQVAFNGKGVSELTQDEIGYKSYLELILSYGAEPLSSHMSTSGFLAETPGEYEDFDIVSDNSSYITRREWAQSGKKQFYFPLALDCLQTDRYFPPDVSITLTFYRKPDNFCLLSPDANAAYKIKIHDMKIFVPYITLHPLLKANMDKMLKAGETIRLPFTHTNVFTKQFGKGYSEANADNCFQGFLPKTVLVGLLDTEAIDGSYKANPFNFQHFNMSSIHLKINNIMFPLEPYEADFTKGLIERIYKECCNNTGLKNIDSGTLFNRAQFVGGMTLFSFDLTPDNCNGFHHHPVKEGNLDIKIKFAKPLEQGIVMTVFACFDKELMFDEARNVGIRYV